MRKDHGVYRALPHALQERQAIDHIVLEVEVRRGHRFGDRGIGREMQDCDGLVGVERGS